MAPRTYNDEQDRLNMKKTNLVLDELPDLVRGYFSSRRPNTTSRTRLSYAYDIRSFFRWLVSTGVPSGAQNTADVTLDDLRTVKARHIEAFLDHLATDPENMNHKAGLARKYAALSSFFDYLYRNDLVSENPLAKVLNVRPDKDMRIIRLQPDEVVRYLNAIEFGCDGFTPKQAQYLRNTAVRDLAIATLLLGTGIRVSECVGLNLSDIYLDKCQISVFGKGGKYRTVPLGDETIDALKKYLALRADITPADKNSEQAVFLSLRRRRMCVQAIEDMITKYAAAIGLQDRITPHKLRKTFGTELYDETGDIYLVARSLGHNSVNTTKNHYIASDEESLLAVRNKVKLRNP